MPSKDDPLQANLLQPLMPTPSITPYTYTPVQVSGPVIRFPTVMSNNTFSMQPMSVAYPHMALAQAPVNRSWPLQTIQSGYPQPQQTDNTLLRYALLGGALGAINGLLLFGHSTWWKLASAVGGALVGVLASEIQRYKLQYKPQPNAKLLALKA